MDHWTVGTLLDTTTRYLREKGSSSPRLDAELLLAETLAVERIDLYTGFERPVTSPELDHYRDLVGRRARHEPVAYILGRAHFRRLSLDVSPAVLIPRPETEELVDAALELLRLRPVWEPHGQTEGEPPPLIVDVGTGSGAIALSLAQEAGVRVLALDASEEALQVARRNRAGLGLEGLVEFSNADLLTEIRPRSLQLVVSNPPYIRSGDMEALAPDIRLFEPAAALDAGDDGLAVLRRLLPQAATTLRPGGCVLLEVGDGQAAAVVELAEDVGFVSVEVRKDLSGKDRILTATLPGASLMPLDGLDAGQRVAVVEALAAGAVIGVPTDTVYGIAARWDSQSGIRRLSVAKGRVVDQPMAVLFSSVDAVEAALPDLDKSSRKVLRSLLPGPFTFVVGTSVARPHLVGTPDSLGVRVPDHPSLLDFLESLGTPLAATSANLSGEVEAGRPTDVEPAVLAHCSIALTDLHAPPLVDAPLASTVVDLRPLVTGGDPFILREGAGRGRETLERIRSVIRGSVN